MLILLNSIDVLIAIITQSIILSTKKVCIHVKNSFNNGVCYQLTDVD